MADRVKNHSLYRAIHHLRHGGLHAALHVPLDEPIPEEKVAHAAAQGGHLGAMARFAQVLKGFHHGSKK